MVQDKPEAPLYVGFSRSHGGLSNRVLGWLIRAFTKSTRCRATWSLLGLALAGCSSHLWAQHYALNLKPMECTSVVSQQGIPIVTPAQQFTACLDEDGHLVFAGSPQEESNNNVVDQAAGAASGLVDGAAKVGSIIGGF